MSYKKLILELELKKKEIELEHYQKKLARYNRANKIVFNTISQEEILDLEMLISTLKLEIEIIQSKIKELYNAS